MKERKNKSIAQKTSQDEALKELQRLRARLLVEEQYDSFLHDFQGIAYRLDRDWKPVFFRGALQQLTGYTEKELLEQKPDWFEIVIPEDLPILKQKYPSREFLKPGFKAQREYRICSRNGEIHWVNDSIQSVTDASGELLYIQGAIIDVTERKLAEETIRKSEIKFRKLSGQLAETNNLKELLLDVITHDLRNAAGNIYGFANLLKELHPEVETAGHIESSALSLLSVIDNASTLARISAGEEIEMRTLNLTEMLRETVDEFRPLGGKGLVEISTSLQEDLFVDANLILAEVFRNYLSNAVKYASGGRMVSVEAGREGADVIVKVRDFGNTIPEENRKVIFERRVTLGKPVSGSSGLGLAIVKKIAEMHGAKVWVEPNQPKGNVFCYKMAL
jgi:PAS domain S-box-containing protein